jgi:hypothetical protein
MPQRMLEEFVDLNLIRINCRGRDNVDLEELFKTIGDSVVVLEEADGDIQGLVFRKVIEIEDGVGAAFTAFRDQNEEKGSSGLNTLLVFYFDFGADILQGLESGRRQKGETSSVT